MFSIYHFFRNLVENKAEFLEARKLEDFPFDQTLLSCKSIGKFPDLAIRLNSGGKFSGGELVELKDSKSYAISSFNSTIPTGKKKIHDILLGENNSIRESMKQVGDDVDSLLIRDVFYLIRGRRKSYVKVCLVHGSFFETITAEKLIASSFEQVLKERLEQTGESFSDEVKKKLITLLSMQESFSRVRTVDRASVKLRFRIMTEVTLQGNILNSKQYPEIRDNTLNLVLPCHNDVEKRAIVERLNLVFAEDELNRLNTFEIKHHLNGYFFVAQTDL